MNSSTFENLKPYLFGNYSKNSITALLRYVIMAKGNHIYLVLMLQAGVSFFWLAVVMVIKGNHNHASQKIGDQKVFQCGLTQLWCLL